jgi:hypothetical protein
MFVKLTDLVGQPIYLRADRIERVRLPVRDEYDASCGAVVMFIGGGAQGVRELPSEVQRKMGSVIIESGGERGGPAL